MQRIILITLFTLATLAATAQKHGDRPRQQFNPQQFEQQLEAYILNNVELTADEKKAFLNTYRELRRKVVATMEADRKNHEKKPTTEAEWEKAIKQHDDTEVQVKKLQQTYHQRMLKTIRASKLMSIIKAEDRFHREYFKKMQQQKKR